ncbi:hypothetical protein C8D92_10783 [Tamilnaduibacter salinus]|uniref:KANL3/Tex30 alpha/beta hydrolase-like domain-containing protein n=1 Tax=Tamilnaduibacter salinus TaxID=1484056 RepID=A0A2U1CV59_9GAMM|nr:alpha/beta fold hydrolase [Tamilnaduibacter salinus]PVY75366.1 hypothetical protein C8D92_10783 [Tamilnaduibacter salinus]
MPANDRLTDGQGPLTLLLAHGAGAPMDSPFMEALAREIGATGVRVVRFEFGYMQKRREDGRKRPPSAANTLKKAFREQIDTLTSENPVVIGGKSMGGRIASELAADADLAAQGVIGCACFGYPFHPPGKPDRWRTDHFKALRMPLLILQGTRDPFGRQDEVTDHLTPLLPAIRLHWLESGEHDFKPTRQSGRTQDDLIREAASVFSGWRAGLEVDGHG